MKRDRPETFGITARMSPGPPQLADSQPFGDRQCVDAMASLYVINGKRNARRNGIAPLFVPFSNEGYIPVTVQPVIAAGA